MPLALLSSIFVILTLVYYVTVSGKPDLSSDDAVLSLLAEAMWKQGTLFPTGWIYNNGDLMTPSGALLVAPLLTWFPNSYELHAVAGVFAIALLSTSIYCLLRSIRLPSAIIWLTLAVMATGLSRLSAIMLYLQTTYVWWPAGFFLGAAILWRDHKRLTRTMKDQVCLVSLALIVFAISFSNPGRAMLMLVLPLYGFERVLAWNVRSARHGIGYFLETMGLTSSRVWICIAVPFAIALILYYALFQLGILQTRHFASNLRWDGVPSVLAHARIFFEGWFEYLGGGREWNAYNSPLEAVFQPLRLAFAIWLTWVAIAEVASVRSHDQIDRKALVAALVASFVPIGFLYLAFSPLAQSFSTTRYFTVPILILVALAAIRVARSSAWRRRILGLVFIPFCLVLVSTSVVRFVPKVFGSAIPRFALNETSQMELARVLVKEGLEWGYATYWNAGVTTIFSEGKTRVNPIELTGRGIEPFPMVIHKEWYSPSTWVGETFLALASGEASPQNLRTIDGLFGKPSRTLSTQAFRIFVYPGNISSGFVCEHGFQSESEAVENPPSAYVASATLNPVSAADAPIREAKVEVMNELDEFLGTEGPRPISIGMRLLDRNGMVLNHDWVHYPIPCGIRARSARTFLVPLPEIPASAGSAEINLVKEGVAWFDAYGIDSVSLDLAD